jgi:AcrR family transcriptional regulator
MIMSCMPRNRRSTPRDLRVNEVLTAASELFLSQGFAKTPMTRVAEAVGVANSAIYWYFPTKDDLLAGVWNRALDEELERLATRGPDDPFERLIQGLIELRPYRQLHVTLHERMLQSEACRAVHDRLLGWIRDVVTAGLTEQGYDPAQEADLVELVVAVFEGANVPGIRTRTATDLIHTLLLKIGLLQRTTAR